MTPFTRGCLVGAACGAALVFFAGLSWINGVLTYEPKESIHYMTGPRQW